MKLPDKINENRLRPWNKLSWHLGFVPFWRCPNGQHEWEDLYGDAIIMAGCRSMCLHCTKRSHRLMDLDNS